jgi:hypothetical protein
MLSLIIQIQKIVERHGARIAKQSISVNTLRLTLKKYGKPRKSGSQTTVKSVTLMHENSTRKGRKRMVELFSLIAGMGAGAPLGMMVAPKLASKIFGIIDYATADKSAAAKGEVT